MEILRACVEEIALSGLEGCTVEELWRHLSSRSPPLSLVPEDQPTRAFVWTQLRETVLSSGSVGVYQLPWPRKPQDPISQSEGVCGLKLTKYKHPLPYRPVSSEEDGVRGSCSSYKERKEITKSVLTDSTDLESLSATYGGAAVLVASQEIRERALLPEHKSSFQELSLTQYCVLEVVGAARHHGILRTDLTKYYLKIDPRSTFHHCKTLENSGLLTITGGKRNSLELVHLLLLSRFPLPPWLMEANYPTLISNLLQKAPGHTLPTSAISAAIGKGYKTSRDSMAREGYIESVLLPRALSPTEKKQSRAKFPRVWHIRLLKPFLAANEPVREEVGGEGEEGEGEGEGIGREPIVYEVPIEMQGYRIIDRKGPQGINNSTFCDNALLVDYTCARQLSKTLIKRKEVVTILLDEDGIKKIRLVTARHLQQSEDYEQLLAEQARSSFSEVDLGIRTGGEMFTESAERYRDRKSGRRSESVVSSVGGASMGGVSGDEGEGGGISKKGPPSTGEVPIPDCVPGPSGIQHGNGTQFSPSSTPESEPAIWKSFKKGKQLLTLHQLRRLNIICGFVKEQQVVVGVARIMEHIRKREKSEGKKKTVDKKTAEKCVWYLVEKKKLCQRRVSVPDLPGHRLLPPLIFTPGTDPEKVAAVEEKLIMTTRAARVKRETKQQEKEGGKGQKRKREGNQEGEEEEEEEEEEESDVGGETAVIPDMIKVSKFQRLKHLHFYLWVLAHGYSKTTPTVGSKVTGPNTTPETEEGDGGEAIPNSSSTPHTLPATSFPWVAMVTQLPPSGRGSGWLSHCDIVPNMPLSLFGLLMPTIAAGQTVPARYIVYFSSSDLQHTPICQLPARLRAVVLNDRRDVSLVNQLLERLAGMNLIQLEGNIQSNKRKEQVFVQLEETHTILDTTVCVPRRSFFLEEARSLFKSVVCTLSSVGDLEHYWYQLQSVCLRTPIILVERFRRSKKRKSSQAPPTKSATDDLHPLPYTFSNTRVSCEDTREYNERGFGAGGLPPLSFSHLRRNWCTSTSRDDDGGMEWGRGVGMENGDGKGSMEWSYGPGMELPTPMFGDVEGGEGETGAPPHKRACLNPKPRPLGQVVHIPSHQIQRHSGGRGLQRFRSKRALETARKLKKVKTNSRCGAQAKSAVLVMDGVKEREGVGGRNLRERSRWLPHEDSFLLLAFLASHALRQVTGEATVSYRQIRDALHTKYPMSRNKSVGGVQSRILKLRRRRRSLSDTVNVCLAEILSEIQGMGSSSPEPTFTSLLSFVTERYSSHGGLLLGKGSTLPSSLSELRTGYDIVGWHNEEDVGTSKEAIDDDHTPNHTLLTDLIIACLGAENSSYDQYAAFKTFEAFPEADVQAAFDQLKSRFLIRKRRAVVGIPRHGGPLQHQSFELATNFNTKLETLYFHGTDKTAADFAGILAGKRSEVTVNLRDLQLLPADGSASSGFADSSVDVESGTVNGGIVSTLISELFSEHSGKTACELVMPERLFDTEEEQDSEKTSDQHRLLQEALEGEEERVGEGGPAEEERVGEGGPAEEERVGEGGPAEEERGGEGGPAEEERGGEGGPAEEERVGEGGPAEEERVGEGGPAEEERVGEGSPAEEERVGEGGPAEEERVGEGGPAEEERGGEGGPAEEERGGEGGPAEEEESSRLSRYSGTGMGSFLRVSESSAQNHGSLTLDLDLPWSSLLDPLPDEVAPPSRSSWAEPTPDSDTPTSPLSLEHYLKLCRDHLLMSEREVWFNSEMYRVVEERGERGVREAEVDRLLPPLPSPHRLTLTDHVQCLLNFEMVVRVGSTEVLLLAAAHARQWCMPVCQSHSNSTTDLVPYRPWVVINSVHPNEMMMSRYRQGILSFIRASPGVSLRQVSDHFSGMLHSPALHQILQSLESEGEILVRDMERPQAAPEMGSSAEEDVVYCLPRL